MSPTSFDRRQVLSLGLGASAVAALTACGGGGSAGAPGASASVSGGGGAEGYTGPKVALKFWNGFTGGDGPVMKSLVDAFNTEHPNIAVTMNTMQWGDYYAKLPAAVAAGQGPEIAIMHVDSVATNAARRVIQPLDDVAKALSLEESDFAAVPWQAGTYDGKRYAIPLDVHPLGFFDNKTVMEQGGLDPGKPPTDHDAYMAALDALKAKGIQGHWASPFPFTGGLTCQALVWQFGGELFDEGLALGEEQRAQGLDQAAADGVARILGEILEAGHRALGVDPGDLAGGERHRGDDARVLGLVGDELAEHRVGARAVTGDGEADDPREIEVRPRPGEAGVARELVEEIARVSLGDGAREGGLDALVAQRRLGLGAG